MNRLGRWFQQHDRTIEATFAVIFGGLLLHAIADVNGWLGAPGFRPRGTLVFTIGCFVGTIAPLIGRRTRMLQLVMAVTSISLMFWSLRFTD